MSQIAYHRTGSGSPIVLIHGIGHRWQAFHDVLPLLAQEHEVIAIDLPGFGQSPASESYDMDDWCDQFEEFFAELGLGRPMVVGNSLGGLVGLELAQRGAVSAVVALSPAGFMGGLGRVVAGSVLVGLKLASHAPMPMIRLVSRTPALRKLSMMSLYAHPEKLTAQDALDDTLSLRRAPGFWPVLLRGAGRDFTGNPKVPVAVGWGDKDRLLLPRQAKTAARRMPNARIEPLRDCGHVPMLDHPEAVVKLVRSVIANLPAMSGMLSA
ncbi:alpha/beta fold hydrolase [Calidifontibacter terrae]